MPFPYYYRLSATRKAIYRRSDAVADVPFPHPAMLAPFVSALRAALAADDRRAVEAAASLLCRGLARLLAIPEPSVQVLAARPSRGWGELHGLYTLDATPAARIQVWMRTAQHKRVVAFRTFLRTLLHEFGHHLDYHYLKLEDSFHTEGFFRRESSLFKQLMATEPTEVRRRARRPGGVAV